MKRGEVSEVDSRSRLERLWDDFRLVLSLFFDRRVPLVYKIVLPLVWVFYFLMPADLIPDVIPILGELDDFGFLVLLALWFIVLSPERVVEEHRMKLRKKPQPSEFEDEDEVIEGEGEVLD